MLIKLLLIATIFEIVSKVIKDLIMIVIVIWYEYYSNYDDNYWKLLVVKEH